MQPVGNRIPENHLVIDLGNPLKILRAIKITVLAIGVLYLTSKLVHTPLKNFSVTTEETLIGIIMLMGVTKIVLATYLKPHRPAQ